MKYFKIILFISIMFCSLFSQEVWIDSSMYRQSEPHIAVNPVNPNNLVATAITLAPGVRDNTIGIYSSFDAGRTWSGIAEVVSRSDRRSYPQKSRRQSQASDSAHFYR